MKIALRLIIFAVVSMSATGCGTLVNLAGGVKDEDLPKAYGGIQYDVEEVRHGTPPLPLGCFFDIPVSLVADTFTYPLVLGILQIKEDIHDDDARDKSPPPTPKQSEKTTSFDPNLDATLR